MKRWIYIMAIFSGLAAGMQSCKKEAPAATMAVEVHSRVYPEGENATAALLFWDSNTFNSKWITGADGATPIYGPVLLQNDIDYYKFEGGRTLTVGMEYPDDEKEYIYATGYAPYNALQTSTDYKTLTVKTGYDEGKTDFLCCDGNESHKGAASDLFTKEKHELKFRHLTPRIRFVGVRDPVMYGVISVNNVNVTLHTSNNLSIPQRFVYRSNNIGQTYVADGLTQITEPLALEQETKDYIPTNADGLSLMSCYVFREGLPEWYDPFAENAPEGSGTVTLTMDISADYSWYNTNGNPVWFETPEWKNQKVDITLNHAGDRFYPGYEYVVYITFKRESVVLQGVQQNWEDGGIHYLPVSPAGN